jgi:uncharacterized protein
MRVVALRRYPVKSMAGEALEFARVNERGLEGDRWFAVEDSEGRFASGKNTRRFRRRDRVFDYSVRTTQGGQVVVSDGRSEWTVGDVGLDERLSTVMESPVSVTPEDQVPHQDMGAVSLISTATLRWCAAQGGVNADPRRLRANIVFASGEPFAEEGWIGRTISAGSAQLRVAARVPRCRMIDIAQDGAVPAGKWLQPLASERNMHLAMYADVASPGEIALGDYVSL